MPRRLDKTLIDYLIIAISPALIMTLIGSLVFFLLDVFYRGEFHGRLQYIFALFIFASVLTARIAIEEGRERAAWFSVPLGLATLLAINRFVAFEGSMLGPLSFVINCGLIGVIWWSADKLTWDCTLIDECEADTGEGLLETVGLDRPSKAALQAEIAPVELEPEATTSPETRAMGWWERFVERRRRPHAPGVWVVYFSLAAVALFGIGQLLIPATDLTARRYAFGLLAIYTASGLGLLLSTSFLGLRRYLRQRRQEMPLRMVNLWLILGSVMIVGVMAATMLLPRPNPEYAVSELPFRVGSPAGEQGSSRYGRGRDGGEEQEPQAKGTPRDNGSEPAEESTASGENETAPNGSGEPASTQTGSGPEPPDSQHPDPDEPAAQDNATGETTRAEDAGSPQAGRDTASDSRPSPVDLPRWPPDVGRFLSPAFLKWLLYGVLAMVALVATWTHRRQWLAALGNLWQELSDLWHRLFGGKTDRADSPENGASAIGPPRRRFADFVNPFAAGTAATWPPEELVRHTFEALEAWARERRLPRHAEETPHEFARRLGANVASLADDAGRLADLYCQAAYAPGTLPTTGAARLSDLWQKLAARENAI